jgi:hypothetical protein
MDMDKQHGFGHTALIWTMDMHGRRNADKNLSLDQQKPDTLAL